MKKIATLIIVLVAFSVQAQTVANSDAAVAIDGVSLDSQNELRIEAYPNPTSDFVTIESDQLISGYEIYNVNGQLTARKRIIKRRKRKKREFIDFTTLADGVYFLHVELETGFLLKQILKQ